MPGSIFNMFGRDGPSMKLFGLSPLGGGIKGFIPQSVQTNNEEYKEFEQQRFQLVQAWNNSYSAQLAASKKGSVITPFRAVNNAGDVLSRKEYSCGGSNQVSQSVHNLRGIKSRMGAIHSLCDGSGVPASSCNGKYVYDSSDYSKYLKQKAIGKNFNDLSYGGDRNNSTQSVIRAIRR